MVRRAGVEVFSRLTTTFSTMISMAGGEWLGFAEPQPPDRVEISSAEEEIAAPMRAPFRLFQLNSPPRRLMCACTAH
jgi:hypothetical protein